MRDEQVREVLLSLVNECEECAMRGERVMCQTAPKEEMRLKCVNQALSKLNTLYPNCENCKEEKLQAVAKHFHKYNKSLKKPKIDEKKLKDEIAHGIFSCAYYALKGADRQDTDRTAHTIAQNIEEIIC